jgi:hypothetical protein
MFKKGHVEQGVDIYKEQIGRAEDKTALVAELFAVLPSQGAPLVADYAVNLPALRPPALSLDKIRALEESPFKPGFSLFGFVSSRKSLRLLIPFPLVRPRKPARSSENQDYPRTTTQMRNLTQRDGFLFVTALTTSSRARRRPKCKRDHKGWLNHLNQQSKLLSQALSHLKSNVNMIERMLLRLWKQRHHQHLPNQIRTSPERKREESFKSFGSNKQSFLLKRDSVLDHCHGN